MFPFTVADKGVRDVRHSKTILNGAAKAGSLPISSDRLLISRWGTVEQKPVVVDCLDLTRRFSVVPGNDRQTVFSLVTRRLP